MDPQQGQYVDVTTGQRCPIAEAMNDGRIVVERVSTTKSAAKTQAVGLITIRTRSDSRDFTVTSAMDTAASLSLSADEARSRGILDEVNGVFVDTKTGSQTPLDDAIDAGLVDVEYNDSQNGGGQDDEVVQTYAVSAVVDQVARKPIPFPEAVKLGLIDRETGCYVNNSTGERVFAAEAIRRGLFKAIVVTDDASLADIDASNRVVVDRIDRVRKNVIRGVKAIAAFKKMNIHSN